MKHLILVFLSAFCLTSCGNRTGEKEEQAATKEELTPNRQQVDPVCDMTRDSSWTDHTIYKNDTMWFCSEGCKMAFEARPAKYIKQH